MSARVVRSEDHDVDRGLCRASDGDAGHSRRDHWLPVFVHNSDPILPPDDPVTDLQTQHFFLLIVRWSLGEGLPQKASRK